MPNTRSWNFALLMISDAFIQDLAAELSGLPGGGEGLDGFPDVFVANLGNGGRVSEGAPVEFPDPGAQVIRNGEVGRAPTAD